MWYVTDWFKEPRYDRLSQKNWYTVGWFKLAAMWLVVSNELRAVIGGETTVESHVGVHLHHQGHVLVSSLLQHGGHRVHRVHRTCCTARKIPFMYSFLGIARPQSQFPHSCVCERFIYSQNRSTYFPAAELAELEIYISISHRYMRVGETDRYNSVLEITVSFLGIHKWESDIYIGFSPALHLQCVNSVPTPAPSSTRREGR